MSEQPSLTVVPDWDVADRLRKSLRHSDATVSEMADYLGVSRTSVSNWTNGRIAPSTQTLRLWALRTGVPYAWLKHGDGFRTAPTSARRPSRLGAHVKELVARPERIYETGKAAA